MGPSGAVTSARPAIRFDALRTLAYQQETLRRQSSQAIGVTGRHIRQILPGSHQRVLTDVVPAANPGGGLHPPGTNDGVSFDRMTGPAGRSAPGRTPAGPRGGPRFGSDAFYAAIGRAFVAMCAIVPVLFAIELVNWATGQHISAVGGIRPHHLDGLDGVVLAPFLHGSFDHVLANSVPLILLGTFVLAAGARRFVYTTIIIAVVSGLGVWFTGNPGTVVVGASGVVFGYLGVLLTRGVVERSPWNAAVGLLIGLLYGWQLVATLPGNPRVSWQAHLFGFVGGVLAAVILRRRARPGGPRSRGRRPSGPAPGGAAPGGSGPLSPPGPGDTLTLPG